MGLDMYLYSDHYVGGWRHDSPKKQERLTKLLEAGDIDASILTDNSRHINIQVCIGYWRKANAIHQWFVDNVQGGVDECKPSIVTAEQLSELLALCIDAKTTRDAKLLPAASGFFFGSTDIDEGYWFDIDHTIKQLTAALAIKNVERFWYRSSW